MDLHLHRVHFLVIIIITGRMLPSGKLPILNLLTSQKSGFSPRRGDSLHRFTSNLAGPTGTWVRLPVQTFTSGVGMRPQNIKNFHFLVKSHPARATPLTDFEKNLGAFIRYNCPTLVFQISCDSHHSLRSYC